MPFPFFCWKPLFCKGHWSPAFSPHLLGEALCLSVCKSHLSSAPLLIFLTLKMYFPFFPLYFLLQFSPHSLLVLICSFLHLLTDLLSPVPTVPVHFLSAPSRLHYSSILPPEIHITPKTPEKIKLLWSTEVKETGTWLISCISRQWEALGDLDGQLAACQAFIFELNPSVCLIHLSPNKDDEF